MNMFAAYHKERTGKDVFEVPDQGFAIYSFPTPEQVWIEDIYTVPEARKSGLARQIADEICEVARKRGCREALGSVWAGANGATTSIQVLLAYGMQLSHTEGKLLVFKKGL